jgi:hypothetical protein
VPTKIHNILCRELLVAVHAILVDLVADEHEEGDEVDVDGVEPATTRLQQPQLPRVLAHVLQQVKSQTVMSVQQDNLWLPM